MLCKKLFFKCSFDTKPFLFNFESNLKTTTMKKLLVLLTALVVVFTLTGCQEETTQWEPEKYAALVSPECKLYLQPEWDKAAVVTPMIIEYIKQNPRWELSLQIHKYINVP